MPQAERQQVSSPLAQLPVFVCLLPAIISEEVSHCRIASMCSNNLPAATAGAATACVRRPCHNTYRDIAALSCQCKGNLSANASSSTSDQRRLTLVVVHPGPSCRSSNLLPVAHHSPLDLRFELPKIASDSPHQTYVLFR